MPDKLEAMKELLFEVIQEEDGGFCAECLSENIFTQGDTWDELRANVKEAFMLFTLTSQRRSVFAFTWFETKLWRRENSSRCQGTKTYQSFMSRLWLPAG
jgi:predicted RNase H-like HicB family nuclease